MRKTFAAAAALCMLAACSEGPQQPKADAAGIAAALKASEKEMVAALKAKDADAMAGHYAADATLMIPFENAVSGQDGIKALFARILKDPNFNLDFNADTTQVAESGEMAYTRGRFTVTQTDPQTKKPVSMSGNYVTVFRKQADGSWKAMEDVASPGAPASAPPPAG